MMGGLLLLKVDVTPGLFSCTAPPPLSTSLPPVPHPLLQSCRPGSIPSKESVAEPKRESERGRE